MKETDKARFQIALKDFLYLVDGTHSPSVGVLSAYWEALKEFDLQKVEGALIELSQKSTEHVAPAIVVEKITGKKVIKAKDAFNEVMGLIEKYGVGGAREHIDRESKTWMALKQMGGLSSLNTGDLSRARSRFYEVYK